MFSIIRKNISRIPFKSMRKMSSSSYSSSYSSSSLSSEVIVSPAVEAAMMIEISLGLIFGSTFTLYYYMNSPVIPWGETGEKLFREQLGE